MTGRLLMHTNEGRSIRTIARFLRVSLTAFLCATLIAGSAETAAQKKSSPRKESTVKKSKSSSAKSSRSGKSNTAVRKKQSRSQSKVKRKSGGGNDTKKKKTSTAQVSTKEIRLKKKELDLLRQEIAFYRHKISKTEKTEKNTVGRIRDYEKQKKLLKKLVDQLNLKAQDNRRAIASAKRRLETLEKKLSHLRNIYRKYVRRLYIRGPSHDTELLLSSVSLNHMFIRARYLRAFTERRKRDVTTLRETQEKIRIEQAALETKLAEQSAVIAEKRVEERNLKVKTAEHTALLDQVRSRKELYRKQLAEKQSAMRKIESLIARLIEREIAKRKKSLAARNPRLLAEGRSRKPSSKELKIRELPAKPISETAFGKLHGRLPWPVSSGAIATFFGNQVHPTLGTVTINKGIDIKTPSGSSVRSVADGTVSLLSFIPGFGHLVIINHDDDFYTVYARLSRVIVKTEQRVRAGQTIAVSGSDSDTPLHFEIWRERVVQNPIEWLQRR